MRARSVIHLWAKQPTRTDGLCTTCWLPSLWLIPMLIVTTHGITDLTATYCDNCKTRQLGKNEAE